jgi:hypothetical protein
VTAADRTVLQWLTAIALVSLGQSAATADQREISDELVDERYNLSSQAYVAATPENVYRVLADYDLFMQFTSAFVETYNLPPDREGRPRFYTRMEGCVLMFCKSFERRGHLLLEPHSEIVAIADPELSDFKYCRERWHLSPEGDGTVLTYTFEMEPDFWVPPVIGPYLIKRTLRDDGRDAIDRIEALAQGREPKPVGTP